MGYQGSDEHKRNYRAAADLGRAVISKNNLKRIATYNDNPKLCFFCGKAILYKRRENKFCSKSCSASHNNRVRGPHSEETKKRISEKTGEAIRALQESGHENIRPAVIIEKSCPQCNKGFAVKMTRKGQIFCSLVCRVEAQATDEDRLRKAAELGRKNIVKQMKAGKWKGWSGVGEGKRSYPEAYIESKLKEDGLNYEFQFQVGRYKVDFAFIDQKIALEVDGKQHLREKQLQSDRRKDAFLEESGWRVFRLPWESIKKEDGRDRVERRYQKFKKLLQSM